MLRSDKATNLSLLFKSFLSGRLSISLWRSEVLLFCKFINIVSILNYIKFIIFLHTFLVICFARFKKYMIWRGSFSNFSDMLLPFICASVIGNLWSICLGVIIWFHFPELILRNIFTYKIIKNWLSSFKNIFTCCSKFFLFLSALACGVVLILTSKISFVMLLCLLSAYIYLIISIHPFV